MLLNLQDRNGLAVLSHTDVYIQALLRALGKHFNLRDFFETGTCAGNTVAAVLGHFDRVFSVEVVETYYKHVVERFRDVPNLGLYCGSSGDILEDLIRGHNISRALFWL